MSDFFTCVNCKFCVPRDEIGVAIMQAHIDELRKNGYCTYNPNRHRDALDREYPKGIPTAAIDNGVSTVFAEFPGDTWRKASLREIVGVVMKAHYENNVVVPQPDDERES